MAIQKVAIMQPYFLPHLSYFGLLKHTDKFILLDTVQFIRHGWIERNRILKPDGGWMYIKVPLVKHSRETSIKDIKIDNTRNWQDKIFAQLLGYKKVAPYYVDTVQLLRQVFLRDYDDIVSLNKALLIAVCEYLHIDSDIEVFSEMNLAIDTPTAPDEWALNICRSLSGVKEYWNPPGGASFFDKNKYDDAGIELKFYHTDPFEYEQAGHDFQAGLSIVDVLMFNDAVGINKQLEGYSTS